jgi:F-box protein 9
MNQTEAELEQFRQQWREEVSAKTKGKAKAPATSSKSTLASSSRAQTSKTNAPEVPTHARSLSAEEQEEVDPHVFREFEGKEGGRRLGDTSTPSEPWTREPRTALEHYEKAVEKETQGSLGDSVKLYRKAFRLDANVHQAYKNKHFPASSFPPPKPKPQEPNSSNAPVTVPNTAHHSLKGLPSSVQSLLEEFSSLSIQGEPPLTELSPPPPCPIASIPDELLVEILLYVALQDVASFARLAQVCKRLAYLVMTEERIWKRISLGSEFGFAAMHYTWACQMDGTPLGDDGEGGYILGGDDASEEEDLDQTPPTISTALTPLLVPSIYPTYRTLFRLRPRIRFNGCYISTVNYTRAGASSPTVTSWNTPIHIVTYYRYLRFFRDGTCISLLTLSEPADVIPYLHPEYVHKNHGSLPSAPMKDALWGRWRLSGPALPVAPAGSTSADNKSGVEPEGTLHVETDGATPKYIYKMALSVAGGNRTKNNKLNWQGYWSYNKLIDDWAEFVMKNYRPFYWSRVKSYGMGLDAGVRD